MRPPEAEHQSLEDRPVVEVLPGAFELPQLPLLGFDLAFVAARNHLLELLRGADRPGKFPELCN